MSLSDTLMAAIKKEGHISGAAKSGDNSFYPYSRLLGKSSVNNTFKSIDPIRDQREASLKEAEEEMRRARDEAAAIRKDAYDEGYQQGLDYGRAAGQKELEIHIVQAQKLLQEISSARNALQDKHEEEILQLIKVLVRRIVHHESSLGHETIALCLRAAMQFVVENSPVTVRLNPDDYARLMEGGIDDLPLHGGSMELLEDPAVTPGGCIVQSAFGEIDATIENCSEKLFAVIDKAIKKSLTDSGREA